MGFGRRIFLVHDDDILQKFPVQRFDRLYQDNSRERVPELAGKRIRYAFVILEIANRKPVSVRGVEFGILKFDRGGRLDKHYLREQTRLAVQTLAPPTDRSSNPIIRAEHLFARRSFQHRHKWQPSDEILDALRKALFDVATE